MRRARTIWTRPNAGLSADRDIAGGGPTHPGPVQGSRRARIAAPLSMPTLSRTSCASWVTRTHPGRSPVWPTTCAAV